MSQGDLGEVPPLPSETLTVDERTADERAIEEDKRELEDSGPSGRAGSHWRRTTRRFFAQPVAVAGLVFIVVVGVLAVLAPLIAPKDPLAQDLVNRFQGPSAEHWLGTDDLGRDTLSRLIYGARTSLVITTTVVFIGTAIAVPIGLLSGYFSGKTDVVVMRLTLSLIHI